MQVHLINSRYNMSCGVLLEQKMVGQSFQKPLCTLNYSFF